MRPNIIVSGWEACQKNPVMMETLLQALTRPKLQIAF